MPPRPVADLAAGDRADEALARGADHDRAAELGELAEPAAAARGCARRVLPKPIPGSTQIRSLVDPGGDARPRSARRGTRGRRRRRRRSAGRPASSAGRPACASGRASQPALGAERRQLGVGAQRGDVVDDRGAGVERRRGDRGLRGVDRDLGPRRRRPAPRPPGRPASSSSSASTAAAPGPGRLAADVEQVGALRRPARGRGRSRAPASR